MRAAPCVCAVGLVCLTVGFCHARERITLGTERMKLMAERRAQMARSDAAAWVSIAQAGSTGGVVGKQGKSVSGGEDIPSRVNTSPASRSSERPSAGLNGSWQWRADCSLDGRWTGNFNIHQNSAGQFTGDAWSARNSTAGKISNGQVRGQNISFTVTWNHSPPSVENWTGSLSSSLAGSLTAQFQTCTWTATK